MSNLLSGIASKISDAFDEVTKRGYLKVTNEPLDEWHILLDAYIKDAKKEKYYVYDLKIYDIANKISSINHDESRLLVLAALSRILPRAKNINLHSDGSPRNNKTNITGRMFANQSILLEPVLQALLRRKLNFNENDIQLLLIYTILILKSDGTLFHSPMSGLIRAMENYSKEYGLSNTQIEYLKELDAAFASYRYETAEIRKFRSRVSSLLGNEAETSINSGEAWSDVALKNIEDLDDLQRTKWQSLILHCQAAQSSKPTAAWKKKLRP